MKHPFGHLFLISLCAALAGCAPASVATAPAQPTDTAAPPAVTLNVFAAASLTEAFTALKSQFEAAHPGVTVVYNFAGSQQLAQQIAQGAPADVFASANSAQMNVAIKAGEVVSGTQRVFARNRLVVIFPKANPAGLTKLQDLAKPGLKLVLADKAVPVGGYALDFLAKASKSPEFTAAFSATVLSNVVSYESDVKSVLGKVVLGEADAGLVYTTDITSAARDQLGRLDIPDALNTIAAYPIAVIKSSPHAGLAQQFTDYVLSADGQAALAQFGFIAATGSTP